jgi:hypothetical protein
MTSSDYRLDVSVWATNNECAMRRRRFIRTTIAVYQIVGGTIGAVVMLLLWQRRPDALPGNHILLALAPFLLVLASGGLLLTRHAIAGVTTVVAQLIQLPLFSFGGVVWKFTAGFQISVWLTGERLNAVAGPDITFLLGLKALTAPPLLGLNLMPLLVLLSLLVERTWSTVQGQDRFRRSGGSNRGSRE